MSQLLILGLLSSWRNQGDAGWRDFGHLSQREGAAVVFERVLNRSQLSELREVGERLQSADGCFQLLLIFYDEELQQTEHLEKLQKNGGFLKASLVSDKYQILSCQISPLTCCEMVGWLVT